MCTSPFSSVALTWNISGAITGASVTFSPFMIPSGWLQSGLATSSKPPVRQTYSFHMASSSDFCRRTLAITRP
ncbi:MAG: hypothetical protein ACLP9L_37925 [Thermoguttaceae bacterium]